jgi:hypothetical protein
MNIKELSPELFIIIFSFIKDNKTYNLSRLVCKNWYLHLNKVKTFHNRELISITQFFDNKIITKNLKNEIIKEAYWNKFGEYIVKEKLNSFKLKIEKENNIKITKRQKFSSINISYNISSNSLERNENNLSVPCSIL